MKRGLALRIAVLLMPLTLMACSTTRTVRSGRQGFFARLDRESAGSFRSKSASPVRVSEVEDASRRGLLQRVDHPAVAAEEKASSREEASSLNEVRQARWSRVARSIELSWPLQKVQFTSKFGMRDGDAHEGVDLRAPLGTPVFAAHDGVVLYSGSGISGYGKLLVLKHSSGISTVYGHNSKLLVKKGQGVRRGQRIALSGSTGRSSGPHLHFEVRTGLRPVDPVRLVSNSAPKPVERSIATSRRRSTLAATGRLR